MSRTALTRDDRHAKVGSIREKMLARTEDFERALSDIIPAESFVQTALTAITENEDLLTCTAESILLSSLKAAQAGLRLDGRQAALVPYKNKATFMPMVQGVLDLISRSPGVAKVEARAVREGDDFRFRYGSDPDLHHVPSPESTGGRQVTHAYAIVWWLSGAPPTFEVVDRDEIEAARNTSRAPNSPAWLQWYGEMARKTAVHRLSKYVDLAPETARRLDHVMDAEWSGMNGRRSRPDPAPVQPVEDLNARIAEKRQLGNGAPPPPEEQDDRPPSSDLLDSLEDLVAKARGADAMTVDLEKQAQAALEGESSEAVRDAKKAVSKALAEAGAAEDQGSLLAEEG